VPVDVCDAARTAWADEVRDHPGPLLRQLTRVVEPHRRSPDGWVTNPVVNPHRLPQFPAFNAIEVAVMRSCPLVARVGALLGGPPALLQSAYYESSGGTLTHLDFNPLDRARPMVGVWIALEPIGQDAGRFFLYPGSHRIPDDARTTRFAELAWQSYRHAFVERFGGELPLAELEAQALLAEIVGAHRLERVTPALHTGDALFWTNRVLHGSDPPRAGGGSRQSLLLHFVEHALVAAAGMPTA